MSRYYGIIDGGATNNSTRCGHAYLTTKANTWTQGIKIYISRDELHPSKDVFEIYLTSGSGDRGIQKRLLIVRQDQLEKLLTQSKNISLMDLYLAHDREEKK